MYFHCIICGKLEKEEYYLQEVCSCQDCQKKYHGTLAAIKGDRCRIY